MEYHCEKLSDMAISYNSIKNNSLPSLSLYVFNAIRKLIPVINAGGFNAFQFG